MTVDGIEFCSAPVERAYPSAPVLPALRAGCAAMRAIRAGSGFDAAWRFLSVALFVMAAASSYPAFADADEVRDAAEVRATVREVLSDPEYRHLFRDKEKPAEARRLPDWLQRFLDWLFGRNRRTTSEVKPTLDLGQLLFYAAIAVLAVVLGVLLVGVWKRIDVSRSEGIPLHGIEEAMAPSRPPGDVPTNEYERRALAAAGDGDFRAALRELVLGSMSWTERAGLIRYRRGLCNRDYVRAVWRRLPQRDSLLHIVAAFERVFYGRRSADSSTFASCLEEFRRSFTQEGTDANLAG